MNPPFSLYYFFFLSIRGSWRECQKKSFGLHGRLRKGSWVRKQMAGRSEGRNISQFVKHSVDTFDSEQNWLRMIGTRRQMVEKGCEKWVQAEVCVCVCVSVRKKVETVNYKSRVQPKRLFFFLAWGQRPFLPVLSSVGRDSNNWSGVSGRWQNILVISLQRSTHGKHRGGRFSLWRRVRRCLGATQTLCCLKQTAVFVLLSNILISVRVCWEHWQRKNLSVPAPSLRLLLPSR